jgi:lipopolysaccharide/colanic/teichoic acid biosynthesis glycosyltransferase
VRAKLLLDKLISGLLLVGSAPMLLVAMIAVKLTSRGPAIYTQIRLGRDGVPFRILKIRSMIHDCESKSGIRWSGPRDPRVTRVGAFLRSTHIDELPQLINVLRGEMSLIGPRPERPELVDQLERVLPLYRERLMVSPGITGLAQIQLGPDVDLRSVASKLVCDLHYVQNMSAWLDFQIAVSTSFYLLGIPFALMHRLLGVPEVRNLECSCRGGLVNLREAEIADSCVESRRPVRIGRAGGGCSRPSGFPGGTGNGADPPGTEWEATGSREGRPSRLGRRTWWDSVWVSLPVLRRGRSDTGASGELTREDSLG